MLEEEEFMVDEFGEPISLMDMGEYVNAYSIQEQYAVLTMQRAWRGYWARRGMWQWDGVLTRSRAVKIQKVWRGRQGRKIALERAKWRLAGFANKIKGRYFIWMARRLLRIKRAEWIASKVTMIQCLYRCRLARAAMRRARFIHHTRMATRIQSVGRGRLGRRRFWGIRDRQKAVFVRMTSSIVADIRLAQAKVRPTLENLIGINGEPDKTDPWKMSELCLFHLLGTTRRDIAVDLSSEIALKFNDFPIGRFILQTALFLTWTSSGKNGHLRMDFLDEMMASVFYNQNCDAAMDFNNVESVGSSEKFQPKESLEADPPARFGWENPEAGVMDELELMYFKNCLKRHGRNALTFGALAACALMRADVRNFGEERTKKQMSYLMRARRLLMTAVEMSSNPLEASMRLEVVENIFMRQHRVLLTRKIKFDGLKMVGYKAWSMLHPLHQKQLNDYLRLDVEVLKCGEFIIVKAELNELPLSLQKLKSTRKVNNIPHLHTTTDKEGWSEAKGVDMAPKWAPYGEEYTSYVKGIKNKKEENTILEPLASPLLQNPHLQRLLGEKGSHHHHGSSSSSGWGSSLYRSDSDGTFETASGVDSDHEITEEEKDELKRQRAAKKEAKKLRLEQEAAPELDVPAVVIRPMVLPTKEVELLLELSVNFTAKERMVTPEEVRQGGVYNVLAEYLSERARVVSCKSLFSTYSRSTESASLRVVLPQIEYRRLEQNNIRTVDYSIGLLQRIYRGFSGKRRFRRLRFRVDEKDAQHQLHMGSRDALDEVRKYRIVMVTKMQCAVKAWIWRRLVRKMRAAATVIQCSFRVFRARNIAAAERRRRDMGPEVVEELRKSVKIGKLSFTVVVYRCGMNYRLVGFDLIRNRIYEGNVFQQEVEALLDKHNATLKGPKIQVEAAKIRPWNFHKVPEFLVENLGIAKMTPNVTANLGAITTSSTKEVLVMIPKATAEMPGIADCKNLNRLLKDTAHVVDRYHRMEAAKRRAEEGIVSISATAKRLGVK